MKMCTGCDSVRYCDKECQRKSWADHKVLCNAIRTCSQLQSDRVKEQCSFGGNPKLVELIGARCTVACVIGGVDCEALWDTGAEVSLISSDWLRRKGIIYEVKDVKALLGGALRLRAVGNREIPYVGYTELSFQMGKQNVQVPFLISKEDIVQPLIGHNVIKALSESVDEESFSKTLTHGIPNKEEIVKKLVHVIRCEDDEVLTTVKTSKDTIIPAGGTMTVGCRIGDCQMDKRMPFIFEPTFEWTMNDDIQFVTSLVTLKGGYNSRIKVVVSNESTRDVMIPAKKVIGELWYVTSVIPAEVRLKKKDEVELGCRSDENCTAPTANLIGVDVASCVDREQPSPTRLESTKDPVLSDGEVYADVRSIGINDTEGMTETERKFQQKVNEIDLSGLSEAEKERTISVIWGKRKAFAMTEDEIGDTPDLLMEINTTDERPVQKCYNSIPKPLLEEIRNHIQTLLDRGWIAKSKSAWTSPVVIVRKKDGGVRMCCDFRQLNKKTVPDKHPVPKIQTSLENLQGSEYFTVLDQSRAYYQGYVTEESRKKTAFVTPWGFYEWVRIPFGLMNAGAKFQRFMEDTLQEYRDKFAMPYLDDTIVYSVTFDEHLEHLEKVLDTFVSKGIKLNLKKCCFFKKKVKYLGRIVSRDGYQMDDSAVEAAQALKESNPSNIGQIRQIMGLLNYHRRHIQNFATLAKPLTDLLITKDVNQDEKRKKNYTSSKSPIEWKEVHQKALNVLIDMISEPPIMAYPDYSEKFFIHTDASQEGLGAILYQKQEGKNRVIAYGSRTLKPSEKNYHSTKLEFMALKWAILDKFHDYLGWADHFTVYTDSNPLLYILESSKVNTSGERWVSELSEYNFTVKYRPGVINKDADCLSRLPLDIGEYMTKCTETTSPNVFTAVAAGVMVQQNSGETWHATRGDVEPTKMVSEIEMLKDQSEDPHIAPVMEIVRDKIKKLPADDILSNVSRNILRERKNLFLDASGVLKRRSGKFNQTVLPEKHQALIYEQLHNEMGHLGAERVFQLAKQRVYWPNMFTDIQTYTQKICRCNAQKAPHRQKFAPLQSIHSSCPLDLITIDYLKLEPSSAGHEYVLLVVDHFTRYAIGYPCKNKSSLTAAKCVYNDFILKRLGIPARILHDQGREFENKLFESLEGYCGLIKSRTTPYHPQTNGCVERMNETLLQMLRVLPEKRKGKWHESVDKVLFAYNSTKHDTTGYSPYYLMFGREPILPLDLVLGINNRQNFVDHHEFAKRWKQEMQEAYEIAKGRSQKRKAADENRWNDRLIVSAVRQGDKVLVKNVREKGGPGKIRAYWEQDVYRVLDVQGPGGVIVKVQKDGCPRGEKRVVHRNMILPCEMFDAEGMRDDMNTTPKVRPERKVSHSATRIVHSSENVMPELQPDDDSDSDEENLIGSISRKRIIRRPQRYRDQDETEPCNEEGVSDDSTTNIPDDRLDSRQVSQPGLQPLPRPRSSQDGSSSTASHLTNPARGPLANGVDSVMNDGTVRPDEVLPVVISQDSEDSELRNESFDRIAVAPDTITSPEPADEDTYVSVELDTTNDDGRGGNSMLYATSDLSRLTPEQSEEQPDDMDDPERSSIDARLTQPGTNAYPESIDTHSRLNKGMNESNRIPRALKDIADFNKRGLKEAPLSEASSSRNVSVATKEDNSMDDVLGSESYIGETEDTLTQNIMEDSGITPKTKTRCQRMNDRLKEWREERSGLSLDGSRDTGSGENRSRTPSEERRSTQRDAQRERRHGAVEQRRGVEPALQSTRSGRESRAPRRFTFEKAGDPSIDAVRIDVPPTDFQMLRATSRSPPPKRKDNYYTKEQRKAYQKRSSQETRRQQHQHPQNHQQQPYKQQLYQPYQHHQQQHYQQQTNQLQMYQPYRQQQYQQQQYQQQPNQQQLYQPYQHQQQYHQHQPNQQLLYQQVYEPYQQPYPQLYQQIEPNQWYYKNGYQPNWY